MGYGSGDGNDLNLTITWMASGSSTSTLSINNNTVYGVNKEKDYGIPIRGSFYYKTYVKSNSIRPAIIIYDIPYSIRESNYQLLGTGTIDAPYQIK